MPPELHVRLFATGYPENLVVNSDNLTIRMAGDFQSVHRMPNGMVRAVGRKVNQKRACAALKSTMLEALIELYIRLNTPDDKPNEGAIGALSADTTI